MLCSVCKQKLAESDTGRKAHMERYHNVLLEAKKTPTYKPMDPKEKAEKIKRMEARLNGSIVLDDNGNVAKYGVIAAKPVEEVLPEHPTTDFGFSPAKTVVIPTPVVQSGQQPVDRPGIKPITSWKEFDERLDALVIQSGQILEQMKEQFK